jgi:hypothetical protein
MERLDIGQVYHGAVDGEVRIFEYNIRFPNLFSRIQIRLWNWSDESVAELMDLDSPPGLYHATWNKLLTRPNRDQLTVDPEGMDTHGTASFRDIQTALAEPVDVPNTITIDLEPGKSHKVIHLTVGFRLRGDGRKIMIETCSHRDDQGERVEVDAARHSLGKRLKEIEEREGRVRVREASIQLGYMKLLEMAKGMERILESFND